MKAIHGDIAFTKNKDELVTIKNGYILYENNTIIDVLENLDEKYSNIEIFDFENKLIIPGFIDAHVHAPQYKNIGIGYDKQLLDWLSTYTFPEESKFCDLEYSKSIYECFVDELLNCGTTRSIVFATIFTKSNLQLFEIFKKKRLGAYIGKVNMDRNCDIFLKENTTQSLIDTEDFICECLGKSDIVKPIITPRFVPTCSDQLMKGLFELSEKYNLKIQSHLSENLEEISWVKNLYPNSKSYSDVYAQFGLLQNSIMAHCVHLSQSEIYLIQNNNTFIAHCPNSNIDLSSGIAPISKYLSYNIDVALGSDISGGHTLFMPQNIVSAIQSSKLYTLYVDKDSKHLDVIQAFYLATKGGGKFFGKVGSFEKDYELDALVIDDSIFCNCLKINERLQKFLYSGSKYDIKSIFVSGQKIK